MRRSVMAQPCAFCWADAAGDSNSAYTMTLRPTPTTFLRNRKLAVQGTLIVNIFAASIRAWSGPLSRKFSHSGPYLGT